ncbi:topless-related protein 1-like isoform X2 [Ziziphus jujuba]|uniref:Topless-related protein 1-like isoform X2 n=1 Tax=Ziziphus jujuba TaxID=326968 RepID=A0ABM3INV5_ZIZJJ|nr:topless-related protein 1-like isoform X2 [Ziziphus jujuba]
MSAPNEELIFWVWKFLNDKRYVRTAHMLERESQCFFDMRYFEEMVINGNWDEAEKYFSSFSKIDANRHSNEIFMLIRKCKFIEALDRKNSAKAVGIFNKDIKAFNNRNEDFYKEMVELLRVHDIWKHRSLSKHEKFENLKKSSVLQLRHTIVKNPLFIDKLKFPSNSSQRLQCLFNQRLESECCFDMGKFEEKMLSGNWDEAEKYISDFTQTGFNIYSNNIFLLIRKCKFLEALDRKDHVTAIEILVNDLMMFKQINGDFFEQMVQLWKLDDIWKHKSISEYGDFESLRKITVLQLKNIIEANPLLVGMLKSPSIASHSLQDGESREISETVRKATYQKDVEDLKWKSLLLSTYVLGYNILGLTYTNEGDAVLSLAKYSHQLWQWPGQVNTMDQPWVSLLDGALRMNNEYDGINQEAVPACFAFNRTESYLYSASEGKVYVFDMNTLKKADSIMNLPSAEAICIAINPQDDNTVAIGMNDSSIIIYNHRSKRVKAKLQGHTGKVTGLAFSETLNMLVSCCIGQKILAWNVNGWKKTKKETLCLQRKSHIHIQFHQDQQHFLLVHADRLAIYEASKLECVKMWPKRVSASISSATFSCDGQIVYASFRSGDIAIFDGLTLDQLSNISSIEYVAKFRPFGYTLVIAAHPNKPYHFAVGLSNGDIYVIEAEGFDPPEAPSDPPKD